MGFNTGRNNAPSRNNAPAATFGNGQPKADAFLNIGINGKKLIGVPLYGEQDEHAQLMEWLQPTGKDDAETAAMRADRLGKLVNSLTATYVPVSKEPKRFDLPD